MEINDLVKVSDYYGTAPHPVTLVGRIDSFEKTKWSVNHAVNVVILPEYSHLIEHNPVTVLGDRLSLMPEPRLPPAMRSFYRSWREATTGLTFPVSELWSE